MRRHRSPPATDAAAVPATAKAHRRHRRADRRTSAQVAVPNRSDATHLTGTELGPPLGLDTGRLAPSVETRLPAQWVGFRKPTPGFSYEEIRQRHRQATF